MIKSLLVLPAVALWFGAILTGCSAFTIEVTPKSASARHQTIAALHARDRIVKPLPNFHSSIIRRSSVVLKKPSLNNAVDHSVSQKCVNELVSSSSNDCKKNRSYNFMQSLAVVAGLRRLSFLFISIGIVQFFRSEVLKVSLSAQLKFTLHIFL